MTLRQHAAERWKRWRPIVRAWLRPPRQLKVTRLGWFFLIVTFGVGLAAINTENNLLYLVLGLMLGLIAASGLLSEMVIRDLEVDIRYPADPVAGEPFWFEITVQNTKRYLPSFAIQIEDRAADGVLGKTFLFRLAAGERVSRAVDGLWSKRGRLQLRDIRISTRCPFGLFEKGLVVPWPRELIVLPRPKGISPGIQTMDALRGQKPAQVAGNGSELYALRPWQAADGVRRIHWRKSASGGGLQSKVFEAEEHPQTTIALLTGGTLPLEDAVSTAALWVQEMENAGYLVGLVAGPRISPARGPAHRITMLRTLALFSPETGNAPLDGTELLLRYSAK
jgi:uncharacterized protein (DUF58 family)